MAGRIISILFVLTLAVTFPVFFFFALIIWLLTAAFDKRLVVLHQFTCFWASFYTWIMPLWRIKTEGREKVRSGQPYVIVSNHQSQLDILVNFRLFVHYKIVSKVEMFKIPFMGWNMFLNGYIKLVRGNSDSVKKMMLDCEKALENGSSVMVYPEGTRSKDGKIKSFKPGAFILAKKMHVPILPVVISGTRNALPKHSMNTNGFHVIRQRVLDEIPYNKIANLSIDEIGEMVKNIMVRDLEILEKEIAAT